MAVKKKTKRVLLILLFFVFLPAGLVWYFMFRNKDKFGNVWSLGNKYGTTDAFEVLRNGVYSGEAGKTLKIIDGIATVQNVRGGVTRWVNGAWA